MVVLPTAWQYQKYSTILILVLCLLCVTPLICSSYSSFAPSSPFFSSWWQKYCELFTHTLVPQCSSSTSSHQPQTTHVFADSRIALLCHALRICVAHAPKESCPFSNACTLSFSSLLYKLSSTTAPRLPATKLICSNVHSGAAAVSASMMLLCCSMASCSFTLRKELLLTDDRLNSRMYSVRWFLIITMPSGLRFQKRFS